MFENVFMELEILSTTGLLEQMLFNTAFVAISIVLIELEVSKNILFITENFTYICRIFILWLCF